jgi:glycosyltransferase involved in cell wall biosynthesis
VYTGRFGSYGRDPTALVEALGELGRGRPDAARKLELVIAGPLTEEEAALMRSDVSPARIVVAGTLERSDALALQRAADALLLVASSRRTQLLNFKLFEYLAAGPPILALAAGTEAGRIVGEAGGEAVPADDPEPIVGALLRLVAGEVAPSDPAARERYSYPRVAEQMAELAKGLSR